MVKHNFISNKSTLVHSRDRLITEVLYLTSRDLFIRFYGGDVRICDMSQFFQPAHSKQYYPVHEFKKFSYTPEYISWGDESYKIGADLLFDYSTPYRDFASELKDNVPHIMKQTTPPVEEYNFDFTNVDFVTGEGCLLSYNSWEEMEAYFDAYDNEKEKFKAAHPDVKINDGGNSDDEIFIFSRICHDFCKSVKEANTKLMDAFISLVDTGADAAFRKYKSAVIFRQDALLSIKERLVYSEAILEKLQPHPRRDRKSCAMSVTSAFYYVSKELHFLHFMGSRCKKIIGKKNNPHREIYESLLSFIEICFDLAGMMDFCETLIENVLSVLLSVDVLSDILRDFCKDRPWFEKTMTDLKDMV